MTVGYDDEKSACEPVDARRHMTTVLLEERSDGEWLATQGGIPVEGRGQTAAEAAAEYCRKIDDGVHETPASGRPAQSDADRPGDQHCYDNHCCRSFQYRSHAIDPVIGDNNHYE